MFVACGIWCLADVSSVSPSSEQTGTAYSENCSSYFFSAEKTLETEILYPPFGEI